MCLSTGDERGGVERDSLEEQEEMHFCYFNEQVIYAHGQRKVKTN